MEGVEVLVTGASGFVGGRLAQLLCAQKASVRALLRRPEAARHLPDHPRLRRFRGDLRDPASLTAAVRGCQVVFHVAADYRFWAPDPQSIYDSNVDGTRHLLQAALAAGVERFVHTSTVGTLGLGSQPVPGDEEAPMAPGQLCSHYKRSKLMAEQLALRFVERGLPVVIVNPSTPVGPGDVKPTPTGQIIVDFLRGRMPGYVRTGLNFVHVDDVAHGHILAAQRGSIGRRYILGHENLSMQAFLQELARQSGRPAPRWRVPYALAWTAGALSTGLSAITRRPPRIALEAVRMSRRTMYFAPRRAIEELGLPQTPIAQALRAAVGWFQENDYVGGHTRHRLQLTAPG